MKDTNKVNINNSEARVTVGGSKEEGPNIQYKVEDANNNSKYFVSDSPYSRQYMDGLRFDLGMAISTHGHTKRCLFVAEQTEKYIADGRKRIKLLKNSLNSGECEILRIKSELDNIESNLAYLVATGAISIEDATSKLGHSEEYIKELLERKRRETKKMTEHSKVLKPFSLNIFK